MTESNYNLDVQHLVSVYAEKINSLSNEVIIKAAYIQQLLQEKKQMETELEELKKSQPANQ